MRGADRRSLIVLAGLAVAACSQIVIPVQPLLQQGAGRVPVVLVPGITGTALHDPATGKLVWGDGAAVFRPRDRGYALVEPVVPGVVRPGGPLEVAGVVERVELGPIRKEVYGPIVKLLQQHGYRAGDLDAPRPGEDLFLFAYDWRQENARSAAQLAERLAALRRARGVDRLEVDLVCQSNGANVCRWLARYGAATLEEAEAGQSGPPAGISVRKVVLVSPSNGGSLENLEWLHRGRRYVPLVGRQWSPEAVFALRSVYEDLPVNRRDLFVDSAGRPLAIDLFDVASWREYQWSVFSPPVARRIERSGRSDLFGDEAAREAFLREALERARRFHELLRRDVPGFEGVRYYLIQNVEAETPRRAVLTRRGGRWRTRFLGDRWLARRPHLERRTAANGDGHATAESQLWLAPQERLALAREPAQVDGPHFELILAPAAQRGLLAYLGDSGSEDVAGRGASR